NSVVTGAAEKTPSNNSAPLELSVYDANDSSSGTVHESSIYSVRPTTFLIPRGVPSVTRLLRVDVLNGDFVPAPEVPGHAITVTASDGDCPSGTVGRVGFPTGVGNTVTVPGGRRAAGLLPVTLAASGFATANAASPARCTALLTASGPGTDPEPSNNMTKLVIDVLDRNDY
ncbi:MAG TPA: hypothetical protein VL403_01330, partial [Candidatus Kryptonia bacterium]|nr:hypothetical protein [Candidatus Kryptonia bacterium]